jgi:hypothetical protein
MISRADDPYLNLKRGLRIGLILSLLIHPLLIASLALYLYVRHPVADKASTGRTETVTITRERKRSAPVARIVEPKPTIAKARVIPKVVAAAPVRPQPIVKRPVLEPPPQAIVVPTYRPIEPKHELANVAVHAPAQPPKKTIAYAPRTGTGTTHGSTIRYTPEQIQAMENSLGQSIAHDRSEDNPLNGTAQTTASVEAPVHHNINFRAMNGSMGSAHGICDSVNEWSADGWNYHYLVCNVMEPDGSMARKALPWPVRFRPREDYLDEDYQGPPPRDTEVAGPLPGWRPAAGHEIDTDFLDYARRKGYPL